MDEGDAPSAKRTRRETDYEKFRALDDLKIFKKAYIKLCKSRLNSIVSLEISNCDAAYDKPFSKATCDGNPIYDELYPFCSLFERGVQILSSLIKNKYSSHEDNETDALVSPLLSYLFDKESHKCLQMLDQNVENETQLMITLAAHFFSKLSVSKSFQMDKYCLNKDTILCCDELRNLRKSKEFESLFGDTSIGNAQVWHGNLDIILDSIDIGAHFSYTDEQSPEGRGPVEVKFSDLGSRPDRCQALAQTITFSFLQKQRHPAMKHFLIPYILASNKEVQFFFYDSENDILLQSRKYNFFHRSKKTRSLSYQTIIASWLVLNYKYLCSGPTEYILKSQKAGFPKFAGSTLDIYKSKLQFQNVVAAYEKQNYDHTIPLMQGELALCPFRWPEKPFVRPPSDTDSDSD